MRREVYQARALYNLIYKTVLNVADNCKTQIAGSLLGTGQSNQTSLQNNWNVDLFPNPASDNLTVVSKTESENLSITIFDIAGKLVYKTSLQTANFISKLDLNLLNGVYLITINNNNNNNNESVTKKLVIAK